MTFRYRRSVEMTEDMYEALKNGHRLDVLKLVCRDKVSRLVHRNILRASSPYFNNLDTRLETLKVASNSDTVDLLIEYLYTSNSIKCKSKQLLKLYQLAKTFQMNVLAQTVENVLLDSFGEFLQDDENFLSDETYGDMIKLTSIWTNPNIVCDQFLLNTRLHEWCVLKEIEPYQAINLWRLIVPNDVLSGLGSYCGNGTQVSDSSFFIPERFSKLFTLEDDTLKCIPEFAKRNARRCLAAVGELMLLPCDDEVVVYNFISGDEVKRVLTPICDTTNSGVYIFENRVYLFDRKEVYYFEPKTLKVIELIACKFKIQALAITRHDKNGIELVYQNQDTIYAVTKIKGKQVQQTLRKISPLHDLFGHHGGTLFFAVSDIDGMKIELIYHDGEVVRFDLQMEDLGESMPYFSQIDHLAFAAIAEDQSLTLINAKTRKIKKISMGEESGTYEAFLQTLNRAVA